MDVSQAPDDLFQRVGVLVLPHLDDLVPGIVIIVRDIGIARHDFPDAPAEAVVARVRPSIAGDTLRVTGTR